MLLLLLLKVVRLHDVVVVAPKKIWVVSPFRIVCIRLGIVKLLEVVNVVCMFVLSKHKNVAILTVIICMTSA